MTVQSKTALKGYFETGDKPTQAQFGDLVDTLSARYFGYLVAASDAPADVKNQADYVCDGSADDVEIQAAITVLGAAGGRVILSVGTFTLAATVTITAKICLAGQARGATIVTAGAAYNDEFFIMQSYTRLEQMNIVIPASCLTDVVTATGCSYVTLTDLEFDGGDSITPYCIHLSNCFRFYLENIFLGVSINGIKLACTGSGTNYGNAACINVDYFGGKAGCTGWLITGGANSVNLISFSYIGSVFSAGNGAGSVGFHITNCGYMTFQMLDLETAVDSMIIEGGIGGGANSNGNVFSGMYIDSNVTLGTNCNYNTFVGGKIVGSVTDNGTGNQFYNTQ